MQNKTKSPLLLILFSAALYGISIPISKAFVAEINPIILAGLLYLGAFIGLQVLGFFRKTPANENRLEKADLKWLAGAVVVGGILGPVSLLFGLARLSGFSTSILLNLEGLATALFAIFIFKEYSGKRFWFALLCMTLAGILVSWDSAQGSFDITGLFLVMFAMACWGLDNNFTRKISNKGAVDIAKIKGLFAGTFNLAIGIGLGLLPQINSSLFLIIMV